MKYLKTYELLNSEDKVKKTNELINEIYNLLLLVANVYGIDLNIDDLSSSIKSGQRTLFYFSSNRHTDNMNFITLMINQDIDTLHSVNYFPKYDPEKNTELQEFLRDILYKFSRKYKIDLTKSELTFYIRYPKVDLLIDFIKKYIKSKTFKTYLENLKLEVTTKQYNL